MVMNDEPVAVDAPYANAPPEDPNDPAFNHQGLTTFCGLPFTNATMFSTARFISLARASLAAQAMCGVTRQFLAVSSGLLAAGGSTDSTSTPAPAITPELSASARSWSTIKGPREVLINSAVGFINRNRSLFIRPCVSGNKGQCSDTTSELRSKSSSVANRNPA